MRVDLRADQDEAKRRGWYSDMQSRPQRSRASETLGRRPPETTEVTCDLCTARQKRQLLPTSRVSAIPGREGDKGGIINLLTGPKLLDNARLRAYPLSSKTFGAG